MNTDILAYLSTFVALISLITMVLMVKDKNAAIKKVWRVPESTFFLLALLGGSVIMVFMMGQMRHKTKKNAFKWRIYIIIALQMVGLLAWWLLQH